MSEYTPYVDVPVAVSSGSESKLRSLMVEDKRQVTSSIFLCPATHKASDATTKIIINLNKCQIVGEFLKWWSDEILFKKSVIPSTWVSMMACLPVSLRSNLSGCTCLGSVLLQLYRDSQQAGLIPFDPF